MRACMGHPPCCVLSMPGVSVPRYDCMEGACKGSPYGFWFVLLQLDTTARAVLRQLYGQGSSLGRA